MTIRTRLRFLIVALLIAAMLCMLAMLNAYNKIESDLTDSATANQVARDIFALDMLLHDFLESHDERPRQQWQNAYTLLGRDIERISASTIDEDEAPWFAQIHENYPVLQKLFAGLTMASPSPAAHSDPAQKILAQALLLRSSVITQAANQLSIISLQEIRKTKRETFALMALTAASLLVIIALLFITKRQIVFSLRRLEGGADAIGKGEFQHRVTVPGKNEFSHLAQALNNMAEHVGESHHQLADANAALNIVIQERQQKEQALAVMAQRLSLATKAATIGVWDWDVASNKLYWDTNMFQLYHVPAGEEPCYETWRRAVHPCDIDLTEADLLRTLAAKSHGEREFRIVWPNGEVRYIQSAELVLIDEFDHATNIIGVNIDVTERKASLDAVQRISVLQRAILDSANFSIISTDVQGIIRVFNASAQRMLGYSEDEVLGLLSPAVLHDPEEVAARARVLSQELGHEITPGFEVFVAKARSGQADENEWTYIRKDGSRFPVLLSVTALHNAQGEVDGYLGVGYDLTERKRLDRMQREFVSTVSHELRTPLTAIRGALGLVAADAVGTVPARAKQMVTIAMNNSERLVRLINDILDIEKIEAGKLQYQMDNVDLGALIRETVASNKAYAEKYHVRLVIARHLPQVHIQGDRDRLIQVLTNLVSNACKFSPPEASVRIELVVTKAWARITVDDKGTGIPENFQDKIFQKFCQADASDTRQKGGTGLGLNISRAIIEQHNGKIGFTSQAGKGTQFWIDLPLPAAHADTAVSASAAH